MTVVSPRQNNIMRWDPVKLRLLRGGPREARADAELCGQALVTKGSCWHFFPSLVNSESSGLPKSLGFIDFNHPLNHLRQNTLDLTSMSPNLSISRVAKRLIGKHSHYF